MMDALEMKAGVNINQTDADDILFISNIKLWYDGIVYE